MSSKIARGLVVEMALNTGRIANDIKAIEAHFGELGSMAKSVATKIAGVTAAVYSLKGAYDLAKEAAQFTQAEQAFANLAASHGQNAQQIIDGLRGMSAETISTANIMQSAGKAMLLGVPAEKLDEMMQIARASARLTGQTVQQAFDDMATGIGRQSKMILDNLGINVSAEAAYAAYAASIGKTASQLTDMQKKQAFANAAIAAGSDIVKRVNADTLSAAEAMAKFEAAWADIKIIVGKVFVSIGSVIGAIGVSFIGTIKLAAAAILDFVSVIVGLGDKIPTIGDKFGALRDHMQGISELFKRMADEDAPRIQAAFDVATGVWNTPTAAVGGAMPIAPEVVVADPTKLSPALTARQAEIESMEELNLFEYEMRREHEVAMSEMIVEETARRNAGQLDILVSALDQRKMVQRMDLQHQAQFALATLQQITAQGAAESEKQFKMNKMAAIANAIVSTAQGAATALQWGFPLGPIFAALVIAAGAAQISKIKSASFGGGGGVGGGIPSAAGAPSPAAALPPEAPPTDLAAQQEKRSPTQNVVINIQNGAGSKAYWQELVDDVIIPGINDAKDRNLMIDVRTSG